MVPHSLCSCSPWVHTFRSDITKYTFRLNPENRGHVCDRQLWYFSRHPNYFSEMLLGWGTFAFVLAIGDSVGLYTMLGPLWTMFLLLFVSGIPFAEGKYLARYYKTPESAARFDAYFNSTPPCIPFPPVVYRHTPHWLKLGFCCEFPSYRYQPKKRMNENDNAGLGTGEETHASSTNPLVSTGDPKPSYQ